MNARHLIAASLLLISCEHKPESVDKPYEKQETNSKPNQNIGNSTEAENLIDKLSSEYKTNQSISPLIKLDSVACLSDGDLTEKVSMAAVGVYSLDETRFFKAIYARKLRCLENVFVSGMSENLSTLQGSERKKSLTDIRVKAQESMNILDKKEKENATALINRIKPEIFD